MFCTINNCNHTTKSSATPPVCTPILGLVCIGFGDGCYRLLELNVCGCDLQRDHEERRALFSCYYWAIYSWNREEMVAGGAAPGVSTWKAALVGLAANN